MNHGTRRAAGLPAYLAAVTREFMEYRPTYVRLQVGRERWEGAALLVAVANARSYGAGMIVAPMAEIDDGLLDVVLVEHVGRIQFLRTFPRVFRGTHITHPAVHTWKGKEVTVETPEGLCPVLVDGDVQCETPIHVQVSQGRAKLLLPAR
jgi:diacylglycerol kinase (ATP)